MQYIVYLVPFHENNVSRVWTDQLITQLGYRWRRY